jgi:hypothetical protein
LQDLNAYEAWRQLLEERQDIASLQLAADDHVAYRVNTVDLKNRLSDVETDRRDPLHAALLRIVGHPSGNHLNGTYVPVEEPSTASEPDMGAWSCPGDLIRTECNFSLTIRPWKEGVLTYCRLTWARND